MSRDANAQALDIRRTGDKGNLLAGVTYEVRYALISLASRPSRYAVASRALTLAALTIGQAYRQSRTHLGHLAAGQSRQGTLTLKPLTLLVRALVKSSALIAVSGSTCETKN